MLLSVQVENLMLVLQLDQCRQLHITVRVFLRRCRILRILRKRKIDTTEYPEVAELLRRDVSAWNSKAFGRVNFEIGESFILISNV